MVVSCQKTVFHSVPPQLPFLKSIVSLCDVPETWEKWFTYTFYGQALAIRLFSVPETAVWTFPAVHCKMSLWWSREQVCGYRHTYFKGSLIPCPFSKIAVSRLSCGTCNFFSHGLLTRFKVSEMNSFMWSRLRKAHTHFNNHFFKGRRGLTFLCRMILNSWFFCLILPNVRITGMYHHTWPLLVTFKYTLHCFNSRRHDIQ